ncbi:MFS transporter [Kitasatospora sp. NPDC091257]|uniref:MFS transporter n=1 Tax=Kitasatospora sp. NPDC091257 TaxID=3364084 RepID=UPI00381911ED
MTAPPLPAATVEAAADDGTDPRGLRRTLAALLLITMFAGFQQSYFTPLFHTLGDRYHVGVTALAWTVTGPALTAALATPLLTALAQRHGHRRVLRATTAAVAAGAALIAIAPDYPLLLAGRVLQGCLAAFLPLMTGLVRHRHGIRSTRKAVAHLSAALMLGVLLGSACSSLLLRAAGTGAVLWVPAAGTLAGLLLLLRTPAAADRPPARDARVDWPAALLLAAALVLIVLALQEGAAWGWRSPATLGSIAAGTLLLGAWFRTQLRSPAPLIDVRRLLRPRLLPVFAVGCSVHYVVFGGQVSYSTYLTQPTALALPTSAVGLVLLPALCGMTLFSACTSRLGQAIGHRRVTVLGAVLVALGAVALLLRHSQAADLTVALGLAGSGAGLISGATRILIVDAVRTEETAAGSGLFELLVSLGTAVGSAVTAAVLDAQHSSPHAYTNAWAASAAVALLGLAAAFLLPADRASSRRLRGGRPRDR